jgi:hypothetical protein
LAKLLAQQTRAAGDNRHAAGEIKELLNGAVVALFDLNGGHRWPHPIVDLQIMRGLMVAGSLLYAIKGWVRNQMKNVGSSRDADSGGAD